MTELDLLSLAKTMTEKSHAPYSHFTVGAALEAENGQIFTGCNVESASYGATICAERTALVNAVSQGVKTFKRIAIVGSGEKPCYPCGICRQMLAEFAPELEVLTGSLSSTHYEKATMKQLLPHSFSGADL